MSNLKNGRIRVLTRNNVSDKIFRSAEVRAGGGGDVSDWERVQMITSATETPHEGQREKRLSPHHPDCRPSMVWAKIYQFAMTILREHGNIPNWRKINSRGTEEADCGPITGETGDGRRSAAFSDWFLALKERVLRHVIASPFEVYEISMEINRDQTKGRMKVRSGPKERKILTRR